MAPLNAWQKLSRVIPGKPFGNGSAGDATISADPNTRATAIGTISTTALTIGSAILANGDVFVIHQTQGTGHEQWEINQVVSGGGTTSIVCKKALNYGYVTGAQVIKFSMNRAVTLSNFTATGWDLTKGGVVVICGRVSISGTGTITATGGDSTGVGGTTTSNGATGAGFKGGDAVRSGTPQQQGDGNTGTGTTSTSANGNGGGGGNNGSHGGGGGNAAAGVTNGGTGGAAAGSADCTTMGLGGGGGGGGSNNTSATERSGGGAGGGVVILISDNIDISLATVNTNGGSSDINSGGFWEGGGGAAGCVLMVCRKATLGTNKATAVGGNTGGGVGKTGSDGRIAVHHSGTITGTTNPTFTDVTDSTLRESGGLLAIL